MIAMSGPLQFFKIIFTPKFIGLHQKNKVIPEGLSKCKNQMCEMNGRGVLGKKFLYIYDAPQKIY